MRFLKWGSIDGIDGTRFLNQKVKCYGRFVGYWLLQANLIIPASPNQITSVEGNSVTMFKDRKPPRRVCKSFIANVFHGVWKFVFSTACVESNFPFSRQTSQKNNRKKSTGSKVKFKFLIPFNILDFILLGSVCLNMNVELLTSCCGEVAALHNHLDIQSHTKLKC